MFQKINLSSQNKILIISFLIFTLLYIILNFKNSKIANPEEQKTISADTMIPQGHVLVPIELANIGSVAALIDQYGIIDLFAGQDSRSTQIASRIKILRAPLNPNQYAVLVTEDLAQKIMKTNGPFWAVIQNRSLSSENNKTFFKKNRKSEVEIEYLSDSSL